MRYKIISDGQCQGTRIVDMKTGEDLENVVSIKWEADVDMGLAKATIELIDVGVDVIGEDG